MLLMKLSQGKELYILEYYPRPCLPLGSLRGIVDFCSALTMSTFARIGEKAV